MAVETHNVNAQDVIDPFPDTVGSIGSNTHLSTSDIDTYIKQNAAKVNAELQSHSVDETSLDDTATEIVQEIIISMSVVDGLEQIGSTGTSAYQEHQKRAQKSWKRLTKSINSIGDNAPAGVKSNAKKDDIDKLDYPFTGFSGRSDGEFSGF